MNNICNRPPYQKATAEQRKQDREYLDWLRTLPCAFSWHSPCMGDVVAAHVTLGGRASKGMKPLFSALPACYGHHGLQHSKGHGVFGPKDWWLVNADNYYRRWKQLV